MGRNLRDKKRWTVEFRGMMALQIREWQKRYAFVGKNKDFLMEILMFYVDHHQTRYDRMTELLKTLEENADGEQGRLAVSQFRAMLYAVYAPNSDTKKSSATEEDLAKALCEALDRFKEDIPIWKRKGIWPNEK